MNEQNMNYTLIDNLVSGERHLEKIREHFKTSKEVLVASPFIMGDFTDFFSEINTAELARFELITTMPAQAFEQMPKIKSLLSLLSLPAISSGNIQCRISLNNILHGKIYLFKKISGEHIAIISSANFTHNGLVKWHEWGVEIYDSKAITYLEKSLRNGIQFADLSKEQLHKWYEKVDMHLKVNPAPVVERQRLDLFTDMWGKNVKDLLSSNPTIWLKPIGVTGNPVTPDRTFDEAVYPLHFANEPKGVNIGDIMICYGVGAGKLLSVYRVFSPIRKATSEMEKREEWIKRWPWIRDGQNITPNYGQNWASYNLALNSLSVDFLNTFPDKNITPTSQSLGALNYGSDKFRLSQDFAEFLLNAIFVLE